MPPRGTKKGNLTKQQELQYAEIYATHHASLKSTDNTMKNKEKMADSWRKFGEEILKKMGLDMTKDELHKKRNYWRVCILHFISVFSIFATTVYWF